VTRTPRQSLATLPSHCVRPLAPFAPAELERWAGQTGQRYVEVDLGSASTRKAVLIAIGRALGFPPWYGANLDALFDCLTDLPEQTEVRAWLIVLRQLPAEGVLDAEQRAALLDVFRDAIEAFADAGVGLRVFHSP
jgi:RNAse (barnase) inhibitor barstar